ncbi:hypothetical protein [Paenibacillus polymyxa]|uniref:hypothetical protein n=1 Tax=Paenibacillus polymyxa TaxID=1406 RepID=UPI002AB5C9FB|nr:hypothetical protein [Paenibacillus polymyxa]MDY8022804.1 hypothetical protein [Paenibacillus polymyxa]
MKFTMDIKLPFRLPIKDEYKFGSGYEFGEFFSTFYSYKKEVLIEDDPPVLKYCTGIEMSFLLKEGLYSTIEKDELFRSAVLNCLEYINRFIDALRSCYGLDYIYNITIADLPEYLIIDLDGEGCLYLTRPQEFLREEITLNSEGMRIVGSTLAMWDTYPDQFLVDKFFDSAKSHMYKEQMLNAVIDLQTSFEIYIRNTHRLILLKEGKSREVIEKASTFPFRNVIEQHIAAALDVDLNFINEGTINQWYKSLYILRNQIVHQGRVYVSGNEAYEAYDAYVAVRNYLADCLVEKGYLSENGKVDLKLFEKNIKGSINVNEIIRRFQEEGLIEDSNDNEKSEESNPEVE